MMKYVLALSIGPVAGFIAAGRRSRDIWYGSTWLSETTRKVAESLRGHAPDGERVTKVEMLLPSAERLDELAKSEVPVQRGARQERRLHDGRVSNKILALVTLAPAADPRGALHALAEECRGTAVAFLLGEIEELRALRALQGVLDDARLQAQIDAIERGDFIEFSAAWAPVEERKDPFGEKVGRACTLRDATPKLFVHPSFSLRGVSRSDLDEGRDSVLQELGQKTPGVVRVRREQAGIVENEALDAIGLLRRASPYLLRKSGDQDLPTLPFPPLSRVAADPWIEGCARAPETRRVLGELRAEIESARKSQDEDFFIWCSPADDGRDRSDPASFRYDAGTLFEGACDALLVRLGRIEEASGGKWNGLKVRAALRAVNGHVRRLHALAGEPIQYYAFVELDGDRIGKLLEERGTYPEYRALVEALDAFADGAEGDVNKHHGMAFYIAGDELTACVPLDEALDLVAALSRRFKGALKDAGFGARTVSASVVIAHVKDDLRGVRMEATRALKKRAKAAGGDHVCVIEMPRAGSERMALGRIDDLHARFEVLVKAIDGGHISLRTEQHLRDHRDRFKDVAAADGTPPGVELAKDAVRRQFERAGRDDADHPLSKRIDALESWQDVARLADEIRIASRVADVRAQRGGR